MLGVWIDVPILDAVVNRINKRAAQLWYYMVVHYDQLPLCKEKAMKDLEMHKDVFNRAAQELKEFGLAFYDTKTRTVNFYNHEFKATDYGIEIHGKGVSPLGDSRKVKDAEEATT